jgi:hypothetical protein
MISKLSKIKNIILIFVLFNLTVCPDPKLQGEYLNQYEEHKTYIFQTKLASCLNLISHSLKGPDGNIYLHRAIKKTKLDRNKFYEKYTIALITQCINNINQGQLEFLLTPENVDAYDTKNETLVNLIKLNYEITSLELTEEENEVKKVIDEILEKKDSGKKKKSFLSFLDTNTLLKILAGAIPLLGFFFFQSRRMVQQEPKKELDDATKEMLELIKQKGKKSPNYKEPTDNKKEKEEEKEEKNNKDGKEKTE